MSVKIVKWSPARRVPVVEAFMERGRNDPRVEKAVRRILDEVRRGGTAAVLRCIRRFDGATLCRDRLRLGAAECRAARRAADAPLRRAVREANRRIVGFARAGLKTTWQMRTPKGGVLGEQFVPFDRVGVYVPGGAAPLASSALMTVSLARAAGVREIVVCTPSDARGDLNPQLLYAILESGATEVYRVGGVQAIGMLAFGIAPCRQVQKVVGPGSAYVTEAKRQVYGIVGIDLVAGPSEIAVLADGRADPACVAADLLSQSEHGTGREKALLVTTSVALARAVRCEVTRQARTLSRRKAIRRVMERGMLLVVTRTLDQGLALCNRFAPEHLELMVRQPRRWLKKVRCAGAVFLGRWSPESAGDFVAGPSHVLPTGGAAARFSGLTVDDFLRRTSFIGFTRADLAETLPVIETFGRVEGLDAHARSARIRFEVR